MTEVSDSIRRGYSDVSRHRDPRGAYKEFHEFLDGTRPTVLDIQELSASPVINPRIKDAIRTARRDQVRLSDGELRYFRGSGIIAVGDVWGGIIGIEYDPRASLRNVPTPNSDPVALEHGNYPYVALRKLGFAALTGRLDFHRVYPDFNERYKREQDLLESLGLADPTGPPHHLGHAVLLTGSSGFVAAGASGMLPSLTVVQYWGDTPELSGIIEQDRPKEWYKWEGDIAAGYHDMVAAENILQRVLAIGSEVPVQGTGKVDPKWLNFATQINTELVNIH